MNRQGSIDSSTEKVQCFNCFIDIDIDKRISLRVFKVIFIDKATI